MRNAYKGTCFRCALEVAPGMGILREPRFEEYMKWKDAGFRRGYPNKNRVLEHETCADQWVGTTRHYKFNPT